MNAFEALEAIESTSSRTEKMRLLTLMRDDSILPKLLDAAMNPFREFWIKKFRVPTFGPHTQRVATDTASFFWLLGQLENRSIVGNEAQNAVEEFLSNIDDVVARKWLARVIQKNLRAGFSVDKANEIWPDLIPAFKVMLAQKWRDFGHRVVYPVFAEPKFDGYRCLAVKRGDNVTLFSRKGNAINENYEHVAEAIRELPGNFALDGELVGASFAVTQRQTFRKDGEKFRTWYEIFDGMDLVDWNARRELLLLERKAFIEDLLDHNDVLDDGILSLTPYKVCNSEHDVIDRYNEFISDGYEGAMVKGIREPYQWGRSSAWLKLKPTQDSDATAVGFQEGEGRLEGSLGALMVKQPENGETCGVGTGLSDAERDVVWQNRNRYLGMIVEVKHEGIGSDGRYRFPRFIRWRDDK